MSRTENTPVSQRQSSLSQASFQEREISAPLYRSPVPVSVMIVPVLAPDPETGNDRLGVLVVKRGVEPMKGLWALPGGYMGCESWRHAGCREVFEETGLLLSPESDPIELVGVESVRESTRLVVFGQLVNPIHIGQLSAFVPNEEVPEIRVLFAPEQLAFSTHTEQVTRFFKALT